MNPIKKVDGVAIATPSTYIYSLQDVSSPEAGRTEDAVMDKMRVAQKVKLQLAWQNVRLSTASAILTAFNPEYITVEYLDPKAGAFVTKEFYVGDRSAPAYNTTLDIWSNVSFNIIER